MERRNKSLLELQLVSRRSFFNLRMFLTLAVFSGARAFALLTPEEQEFALNTTVTYAPQAYEYIRQCKASEDGLTIPTMGREVSIKQISEWSWDKVAEHPVSLPLSPHLANTILMNTLKDGLEKPYEPRETLPPGPRLLRLQTDNPKPYDRRSNSNGRCRAGPKQGLQHAAQNLCG